jgi:hypothetical protein
MTFHIISRLFNVQGSSFKVHHILTSLFVCLLAVSLERERDELRPLANALPPAKQSPLRANGLKNNLLRADQILTQRANGSAGQSPSS